MVDNMPSCTGFGFSPDGVVRCAELPNVGGLKHSTGDLAFFASVRQAVRSRPDFRTFVGPEELLAAAVRMGAHGGVNGGAKFAPALFVRLFEAARGEDDAEVARLQSLVERIGATVYGGAASPSRVVLGVRAAVRSIGIGHGWMLEPWTRVSLDLEVIEHTLRQIQGQLG
ncbi:MAG: dihydrodipicolinate synthase family protein [bacterium]